MNKPKFVDSVDKPDHLVAFLLFGIAFVIRIYLCPSYALSTDESFTANVSLCASFDEMFKLMWNEGSPPLMYLILRLWTSFLSDTDLTIKMLGIVLSSAVVPVAYLATLGIFGSRRIAVSTCILCLFSPILIRFGAIVRPYALTCIFSLLSTWTFFSLFKEKPGIQSAKLRAALYVLFTTLNAYSHLWGLLFNIAQAVVVAIQAIRKNWSIEQVQTWAISASISAVLFVLWLFVLFSQIGKDLHPWYHPMLWYEFLAVVPLNLTSYTVGETSVIVPFYATMVLSALLFYGSIIAHLKDNKGFVSPVSCIALIVFCLAIVFAMNDIPYKERYLLALSVISYALICDWLDKAFHWIRNDFFFALIPLGLFSVVWFNQLKVMHQMPEASVGALLTSMKKAGDIQPSNILVVAYNSFVPEVMRKVPETQIIAVPFTTPFKVIDWPNQMAGLESQQNTDTVIASLISNMQKGRAIWYIGLRQPSEKSKDPYATKQWAAQQRIKNWLMKNARPSGSPRVSNSFDGSSEAIKFTR